MSSALATDADYKFFDFLSPYRWPTANKTQIKLYRELVADGDLHIETMLENALAVASNGQYRRIAEAYRDYDDDSDAKKSTSNFRNNDIAKDCWTNSCAITGLLNKKGLIRALCYSVYQDKFYFFAIPYNAYQGMKRVDVLMDNSIGYQEPHGIPKGKWTKCQVDSFERLATITENEANQQWLN
jgi:hypothetical protein